MEKIEETNVLKGDLVADAEDATTREHELTFIQAINLWPKAVGWSMLMSAALIMDGYDTKLISSLIALPAFQKAYGVRQANGSYQISAPWQSGLTNGSNSCQMIGLVIGGYLSERFGFRKTMLLALLMVPCFIFIQFFAPGLEVLEVGQILLGLSIFPTPSETISNAAVGIPLGMFQTVTTVYALEVTPTVLRGYLTSYVNMCWVSASNVCHKTGDLMLV
jgi:SP family general alpha glucoside:H+ symporter-like MFS transporter